MAWVFDDPWDDYMDLTQRWDIVTPSSSSATPSIVQGVGRRSTAALEIPPLFISGTAWTIIQKNIPYQSAYIAGFAINVWNGQSANSDTIILSFMDGSSIQVCLCLAPDGHISVKRGSTLLGASTNPLLFGDSHYLEIKATINSSTGAVVVRLDNSIVINLSSINTDSTGTTNIGAVQFGGIYSGAQHTTYGFYVDDFILLDTTGSQNNGLIGDHYLGALYTNGAGDSAQFSLAGANANWKAVIDMPERHNTGAFDTWIATADYGDPSVLLNGIPGQVWLGYGALPHHVDINMGAVYTFDLIYILPIRYDNGNPKTIELYVSDDGATWGSAVETITNLPQDSNPIYWKLSTSYTHRYFRLNITANYGGIFHNSAPDYGAVALAKVSATTVYVYDSVVGHFDLYNYQDVSPTLGAIAFASVWPYTFKEDGGYRSIRVECKSVATTVDNGADLVLSTQPAYIPCAFEVDPATAAPWTIAGFNAAQFGPKLEA